MKTIPALMILLLAAGCGGGSNQADADPLAGTAWSLAQLAQEVVPAEVTVTARFDEGRIGGKAGCNQYFASYEVKGDSLRIGPAGATKMMCPEPQMAVEDAFLAALQDVRTFKLVKGRLQLVRSGGEVIEFAAAAFTTPKE